MQKKVKQLSLDFGRPVLFAKTSRNRRLLIAIRPFKPVRVSMPHNFTIENAYKFVKEQSDWVVRQLEKVKELEKNKTPMKLLAIDDIDIEKATKSILERLKFLAVKHGFQFNRVCIRNQKTRWGSCSNLNNINLNIQLIRLEQKLIDYVIMHELVHLKVRNHSPKFWHELDKYIPNSKKAAKEIRAIRP